MPAFASRLAVRLGAAALALALFAPAAQAQYFGRNQVRYDDFDYRVLVTDHFDIYYYDGMDQTVRDVGRMAERWYDRFSAIFGHEYNERKTIVLYADDADFRQTNIAQIGEGTQGVTEGLRQRVVLAVASTNAETDHVLGHELVHQFQYDIAQRGERFQNFIRTPLFVIEGMAEYFSVGREDALTSMWMRDAVLRDDVPSVTELIRSGGRYNEYQYGQPFWAYVAGEYGDDAAVRLFRTTLEMPLDSALVVVTGLTPDSLSAGWARSLRDGLLPSVAGREVPTAPRTASELDRIADERTEREAARREGRRARPPRFLAYPDSLARLQGTRLLANERDTGGINIAPQLSPDGRTVAYLSERDLFGIDLYLADAASGEVLAKLASVGSDPHTDALRFIESAGTWRPDGAQFAYVIFAGGNNEIAVLDVASRRVVKRLAVEGIGAIRDLSFSPDGGRIVFSGAKGGVSDLYIVDVASGTVRQMTNDRFADLQPAWSPDGQTIAFVTDRGPGTDFDRLAYAQPRLALMTVATGEIEPLSLFAGAKHINPAWSPDGTSLYFISDRGGYNDVFRLEVARRQAGDAALSQVTRLATGVAGIADLSPAMSVSRQTGDIAYSVFEGQRYTVYRTDAAQAQGTPVEPVRFANAATLPPGDAASRSRVEAYLADARSGLPATADFASRDYRSRLTLDYISQPQVGVGYDQSNGGVGVGGGVAFLFSDQLSDKSLGVAVQANGTLQDIGAQATYLDRGRRFVYGAQVGHIPILQAFISGAPAGSALPYTRYFYRTFIDQARGIVAYPFNQTQRLEASAGFTRYGFSLQYDAYTTVDENGDGAPDGYIYDGRRGVEGFNQPALNLGTAGIAFVGDYSNFGFTSPIRGGRYRFGIDGTVGSLSYAAVTADYRRYAFTHVPGLPRRVPITFAGRVTHFGRYGAGADDNRLNPLFLGYGQYIRGYTAGSFPDDNVEYGYFQDRLLGTSLGVATLEARIPILGVPQLGLISFPFLPTELVFFADAGMAWGTYRYIDVSGAGGRDYGRPFADQRPLFSAGVSGRINVLGALVIEPYYAFPISRYNQTYEVTGGTVSGLSAGKGVFGVNLTPGW